MAVLALLIGMAGVAVAAETTNPSAASSRPSPRAESVSKGIDASAFRIVTERNIFNANRSGGQVRLPSRRPTVIETFTLVGTMAYEKGTFAFFEGSSSGLTKVIQADGVIAGHKLLDIHANSVKLEADGKEIELPVGSQMRREDEGTWQVTEARAGTSSVASSSKAEATNRSSRTDRSGDSYSRRGESSESGSRPAASTSSTKANDDEVLKRLMERREKESP